jgi:hypothetical protein
MEEQTFRGRILSTTDEIRGLREMCIQYGVPEKVQDGYEEIIDRLLICLGINQGQRELFWTLTDPD